MQKVSYYQHCIDQDIISHARPLLEKAGFKLRDGDGKIYVEATQAWDTPWHHIKHSGHVNCHLWHRIMFDVIFQKRFVPSECQQCWKIVVRPQSLLQLFALLELQKRLDRPSKCGIEVRESVHGLYGGYFYTRSLEEGLASYKEVRSAIDEDQNLGPNIVVLLKRACTEFEVACGPSDKWEVTPEQQALEALVNKWFVHDINVRQQSEHVVSFIHKKWIEWAYANGDSTYQYFTNGKPLYQPYVTYHHLADEQSAKSETGHAAANAVLSQ